MPYNVGFIGLGIMGERMARNILAAGHTLTVYNRSAEKTAGLAAAGAKVASSPAALGAGADVVILMLTGPEAVDAILEGEHGLLAAEMQGKTVINMSTVTPAYSRALAQRLAQHKIIFLDIPVSGSKKPAEDGTLVLLAGGPQDNIGELEHLLLTMGKKVLYCGEAGMGSTMKMVINLLLAVMMEGLCEAVVLAEKSGLSADLVLDTVLAGPLGCGLFNLKAGMLKSGDFAPQFPLKHMEKDLRFILETARQSQAATPVADVVADLFRQGMEQGMAELDFAAVKKIIARQEP